MEKGGNFDWQFVSCFDPHECSGTDLLVITRPIGLKPRLFTRLGWNYIVEVSLKTQADDSFPRIINRKIHFRYIGVYILGNSHHLKRMFFYVLGVETLPPLLMKFLNGKFNPVPSGYVFFYMLLLFTGVIYNKKKPFWQQIALTSSMSHGEWLEFTISTFSGFFYYIIVCIFIV